MKHKSRTKNGESELKVSVSHHIRKKPKRSRQEMELAVLWCIGENMHVPNRIMRRSNLAWYTLLDILARLTGEGLIVERKQSDQKRYYVTPKGREALKTYEKLRGLFNYKKLTLW